MAQMAIRRLSVTITGELASVWGRFVVFGTPICHLAGHLEAYVEIYLEVVARLMSEETLWPSLKWLGTASALRISVTGSRPEDP